MREALINGDVDNIINRYDYLKDIAGIPNPEAKRAVINEFSTGLNITEPWRWRPDDEIGGDTEPTGPLTDKIFASKYPPIDPLPVFAVTSPFDNDGFDHKNPDPGYAGGRSLDTSEYRSEKNPEGQLKSEANPYENQNAYNYIDAPFKEPAEPSMHNEYGFNVKKSIPEWRYDVEEDQGGIKELIIERDKKTGQWVKHGTTKGENITDHSLAPILDHQREKYLHGNKNKDDKIEMPHMVVSTPEFPDDPHMTIDKLEEVTQQRDISLDDIPGETPEKKKEEKKNRLALLLPWLPLLGGAAGAGYFLAQPKMQLLAKFIYTSHEFPEICESYNGKTYDLLNKNNRPVPPSENLGYTNTHPNCKCYWEFKKGIGESAKKLNKSQKKHIKGVNKEINQAAKKGELHKVNKDGGLTEKTYKTNFRKIQETIQEIRNSFDWLSDDYFDRIKAVNAPGKMFLIRASSEAITDHRAQEGEPLRRWLKPDELHAMARTAIGSGMDINHHIENKTNAQILDSEFNKNTNEIQMIVNEQDPEILQAIANQQITAVSINGGAPRTEKVECPDCDEGYQCECFIVPEGVVLGELDDVALTWVVTDPRGIMFRGRWIAPATPGVKTTAIEPI